jgi:hypothetical protein
MRRAQVRHVVMHNMKRYTGVNDDKIKEMRSRLEQFQADMQAKVYSALPASAFGELMSNMGHERMREGREEGEKGRRVRQGTWMGRCEMCR